MDKKAPEIYLRADGGTAIGLGHIYRLLALASFIREKFACTFLLVQPDEEVRQLIHREGFAAIALQNRDFDNGILSEEIQAHVRGKLMILDGYAFSNDYQMALKQLGCIIVFVDDLILQYDHADRIINHTGGITAGSYTGKVPSALYLGPRYALIRKEFMADASPVSEPHFCRRLFVCLGGSDAHNHTQRIMDELESVDVYFDEIHVVVGASYRHLAELRSSSGHRKNIKIYENLNSTEMAGIMKICGIAVTAASTVSYEYCAVGGILFLLKTADNQENIFQYLIAEMLALPYASFASAIRSGSVHQLYREFTGRQEKAFDGRSPQRIQAVIIEALHLFPVSLRRAEKDDMKVYFDWANDVQVRSQAYNTAQILWEDHVRWFTAKMGSEETVMYYFSLGSYDLGQVRFDLLPEQVAIIDYSIDKAFRGMSFGKKMLGLAITEFGKINRSTLLANVRSGNAPSRKIFESMDFDLLEEKEYQQDIYFVYRRQAV